MKNNLKYKTSLNFINDNNTHLGYNKIKTLTCIHNNLNNYYIGKKNNTFILNNKITYLFLIKAIIFFTHILKKKGKILIVNTNPELSKLTLHLKKKFCLLNIFFIDNLKLKNIITNYKKIFFNIKNFINFYNKYNSFLNANKINFPKYKKMKNSYKGFLYNFKTNSKKKNKINLNENKNLNLDLIILISCTNTESLVEQSFKLNIPIIGFVEKNTNIEKITYPILNNNNNCKLILFFFSIFSKIIKK